MAAAGRQGPAVDVAIEAFDLGVERLEAQVDRLAATMAGTGVRRLVVDGQRRRIRGSHVVFTGADPGPTRDRAALATRYGFTAGTRVARRTDLVVAADAGTSTRAVTRARSLGLPVVLEEAFWTGLGEPAAP